MTSPNVRTLTDQNFDSEVLQSPIRVLVEFSATWAGPCRELHPIVEKIADDFEGQIRVGRLDIDESPEVPRKYGVRSVPFCLVFQDGQKTGSQAGLASREQLLKLLGLA